MREQSHIDDMRAAVRGDLERARSRGASIFEQLGAPPAGADNSQPGPEPEPVAEQEPRPEPAPPELPPAAAAPPPEQRLRDRFVFWRR